LGKKYVIEQKIIKLMENGVSENVFAPPLPTILGKEILISN
jgi:hypothetical protein